MQLLRTVFAAALLIGAAGCSSTVGSPDPAMDGSASAAVTQRLDELQLAVSDWAAATDITRARAAAETAANLVVGPGGPGFGDRDGDGAVGGDVERGLLPGRASDPEGLATAMADSPCVRRDVLGTTADDADEGWSQMSDAIAAWNPSNNTMPTLSSHPMRVVGWATFTVATDNLELAHEYAGHAQLHVDVSRNALDC